MKKPKKRKATTPNADASQKKTQKRNADGSFDASSTTSNDLVLSMYSPKYQQLIDQYVKDLLSGEYKQSYDQIASKELTKVKVAGGTFFKVEKTGREVKRIRAVEAKESEFMRSSHFAFASLYMSNSCKMCLLAVMVRCLKQKLKDSRERSKNVLFLNLKYDEYKNRIQAAIEKEGDYSLALSRAAAIGKELMEELKKSGVNTFFIYGNDIKKTTLGAALDSKSIVYFACCC